MVVATKRGSGRFFLTFCERKCRILTQTVETQTTGKTSTETTAAAAILFLSLLLDVDGLWGLLMVALLWVALLLVAALLLLGVATVGLLRLLRRVLRGIVRG